MLVWCFGGEVLFHMTTVPKLAFGNVFARVVGGHLPSGSDRIASVQDVEDDIRGVNDLVQLVPDALRLSLVEDGLLCGGDAEFLLLDVAIGELG